jgi:hypothetical protein
MRHSVEQIKNIGGTTPLKETGYKSEPDPKPRCEEWALMSPASAGSVVEGGLLPL